MKNKIYKYLKPAIFFGAFLGTMFIWSLAIGPVSAKKQMVLCYKFKSGLEMKSIENHLSEFKDLKLSNKSVINYSAGYTSSLETQKPEYDVMHYLTFKSEEDMNEFLKSSSYVNFQKDHQNLWDSTLVLKAEIK